MNPYFCAVLLLGAVAQLRWVVEDPGGGLIAITALGGQLLVIVLWVLDRRAGRNRWTRP